MFRRRGSRDSSGATSGLASIGPGVPGRCPECDGFGFIEHTDLVHRFQVQHCRDCAHRWEYRFDENGSLIELVDIREPAVDPGVIDLTEPDEVDAER